MLSTGKGFIQWIVLSTFRTTWPWWISAIIIHSKYSPVSDWVEPHAQFTITNGWTVIYIEPMMPVQWRHRETYPPLPSASVDNTLLDLQNSSYPTQPHSIIANSTFEQPGHGVLIDKIFECQCLHWILSFGVTMIMITSCCVTVIMKT